MPVSAGVRVSHVRAANSVRLDLTHVPEECRPKLMNDVLSLVNGCARGTCSVAASSNGRNENPVMPGPTESRSSPARPVMPDSTLLDRFLRYVRIDTQADERSTTYPSTPGQLELGRLPARRARAPRPRRRPADRARHRPRHRPRQRARRRRPSPSSPTSIRRRRRAASDVKPQVHPRLPRRRHRAARRPDQGDPRGRQPGAGRPWSARRSSPPTARRCSAPTTRPASRSSWRRPKLLVREPDVPHGAGAHLLHLRRGDRPRRRSTSTRTTSGPRSRTRSTAAGPARSTARRSPPTWRR